MPDCNAFDRRIKEMEHETAQIADRVADKIKLARRQIRRADDLLMKLEKERLARS